MTTTIRNIVNILYFPAEQSTTFDTYFSDEWQYVTDSLIFSRDQILSLSSSLESVVLYEQESEEDDEDDIFYDTVDFFESPLIRAAEDFTTKCPAYDNKMHIIVENNLPSMPVYLQTKNQKANISFLNKFAPLKGYPCQFFQPQNQLPTSTTAKYFNFLKSHNLLPFFSTQPQQNIQARLNCYQNLC